MRVRIAGNADIRSPNKMAGAQGVEPCLSGSKPPVRNRYTTPQQNDYIGTGVQPSKMTLTTPPGELAGRCTLQIGKSLAN